jgi:hypothetical protein
MKRHRPVSYFAEAPVVTIIAVAVTAAVAIDGIAAIAAAPLARPAQCLCAALICAAAAVMALWEIAGPLLWPAVKRILGRRS